MTLPAWPSDAVEAAERLARRFPDLPPDVEPDDGATCGQGRTAAQYTFNLKTLVVSAALFVALVLGGLIVAACEIVRTT